MVSVMVWSPAHSNKDQHLHSSYQLQHGWCVFCPRHTARIRRTAVDARTPTPTTARPFTGNHPKTAGRRDPPARPVTRFRAWPSKGPPAVPRGMAAGEYIW